MTESLLLHLEACLALSDSGYVLIRCNRGRRDGWAVNTRRLGTTYHNRGNTVDEALDRASQRLQAMKARETGLPDVLNAETQGPRQRVHLADLPPPRSPSH